MLATLINVRNERLVTVSGDRGLGVHRWRSLEADIDPPFKLDLDPRLQVCRVNSWPRALLPSRPSPSLPPTLFLNHY